MNDLKDTEGTVQVLDSLATVSIREEIRAYDCFGRVPEGLLATGDDSMKRPMFAPIPQVKDIALINSPLVTGVTMFDALAPIGKGQNMLMIGHDIEDMRRYVCDILSSQKGKKTKCIYAATGNKEEVTRMLGDANLLDDVILVSDDKKDATDTTSEAAEATVIAATACSVAESFAIGKGMDTLVIIDNIDQHKKLWDATTRVLVDVFGVDAVVKGDLDGEASSEMRAFFSSLVQRSAKYKSKRGGGSVTLVLLTTIPKMAGSDEDAVFSPEAFEGSSAKVQERIDLLVKKNVPLTSANLRKIKIPIPSDTEGVRRLALQHIDDLISMSDGQIWLDEALNEAGRRPAMDFQKSVTRIGIGADTQSRADAAAIRRVVEGLRLDLSQAGSMDGAEIGTNASKKQMRSSLAWLLAMHQPSGSGIRRLSESCTALLAASKGYLNDSVDSGVRAGTPEGETLMTNLLEHVNLGAPAALEEVDSSEDLTDSSIEAIEEAIKSYFS
jgi:F-type H+-transporting ATPase subunit alpha